MKQRDVRHTALAFYARADSMEVTLIQGDSDNNTVFAELMPSTAHPNVVGVHTGTMDDCHDYMRGLDGAARLANLPVKLTLMKREELQ